MQSFALFLFFVLLVSHFFNKAADATHGEFPLLEASGAEAVSVLWDNVEVIGTNSIVCPATGDDEPLLLLTSSVNNTVSLLVRFPHLFLLPLYLQQAPLIRWYPYSCRLCSVDRFHTLSIR